MKLLLTILPLNRIELLPRRPTHQPTQMFKTPINLILLHLKQLFILLNLRLLFQQPLAHLQTSEHKHRGRILSRCELNVAEVNEVLAETPAAVGVLGAEDDGEI